MPQTFIAFVLRHKNALGRGKIRILTFIGLIPGVNPMKLFKLLIPTRVKIRMLEKILFSS